MILTLVAIIAVTVMLWLVVPVFAKMFKDMDAELPGVTQFVVDASDAIVKYGHYGARHDRRDRHRVQALHEDRCRAPICAGQLDGGSRRSASS